MRYAIRRRGFHLFSLPILLHLAYVSSAAKDQWIRVQSANFLLVGNDSEKDMRQVAMKFEQFRDAFSRILPQSKVNSSVPTRVLVFKSDNSFKPFKPLYQGKPALLAGFFQKGLDVNHICLTSEYSEDRPFAAVYHEYVHQLTGDNVRNLPLWFREGIAEYYSSFEAAEKDRQISVGKPIASHVYLLRENRFLPLATLFAVRHDSPEYNERHKQGVFYAESWALVHYLIQGDNGKHKPKLIQYLNLLASGVSLEESFAKAFQTGYAQLERDLQKYIQLNAYGYTVHQFEKKLDAAEPTRAVPLDEAEVSFYLGDLLLHTQRLDDAENHLKKSLELNPNLAPALASMGTLRLHQKQWAEAREYFQRAVAADSSNYLVHYHYANVLLLDREQDGISSAAPVEKYRKVQSESKRAIELAPWFVESYRLLALAVSVTNEELPTAVELLKKAQTYAPGRQDLRLDMARLHAHMEDYSTARRLLEPITRQTSEPQIQQEAEILLARLQNLEEQRQLIENARQQTIVLRAPVAETQESADVSEAPVMKRGKPTSGPSSEPVPEAPLELHPPKGEKVAGVLARLECSGDGVIFVIKSGLKTLRFHTDDPEKLLLYKQDGTSLGTISMRCGPLSPPSAVVATYHQSTTTSSTYDGTLLSVLFVDR
jgi:tetratricopeptide (TPR) repeat protein